MEYSTLLLSILTVCICAYYFTISQLSHFKRLNIPYVQPMPFLGNLTSVLFQRKAYAYVLDEMYHRFSDAKYFGFYDLMTPAYVIRDPELVNAIAIKHFDNFCNHRNFVNEDLEPITRKNLFGLRDDHWREMRKLLTPSFTSSKMKMMFGLICQCAENFTNHLVTECGKSGKTYNVKNKMSRYATDVVATCAFGIAVDSFKHPNNEFFIIGNERLSFTTWMSMKLIICRNMPTLAKLFRLNLYGKKVENFFKEIIMETVKIRDEQGITRPDMIQLMMETRNKDHGSTFDIDEITAQAFVFFLAGFETSSSAMCFLAHEIAVNPDVQDRLRTEIDDVVKNTDGKPTYEAIHDMKYLDAVIHETLRFYPLTPYLDRVCTKDFEMPPATPDGKSFTLKPGELILIPTYPLNRNPKHYLEPNKFNPDRFLNNNVNNSLHITFGIGPRICIGNRFALMQMKIMIFYLLWRCIIEPDVKTIIPLKLNKSSFPLSADGGFWLKMRAR